MLIAPVPTVYISTLCLQYPRVTTRSSERFGSQSQPEPGPNDRELRGRDVSITGSGHQHPAGDETGTETMPSGKS